MLAKMKEQMEALRLEQKKREEEELARIRAEEEAERKRLEEVGSICALSCIQYNSSFTIMM